MSNYILVPAPSKVDYTFLNGLKHYVLSYPNHTCVINFKTTKEIDLNVLSQIESSVSSRVEIRVEGGYDDRRIKSYTSSNYVNMHKYDNIYTISEIRKIIIEIKKIEEGINPNWNAEQKLMYFIGVLKNKIIYHPFHETASSKEIRSLRGLFSHNTVCAGYAVILKELCDRNGIECQYVEGCTNQEDFKKGWLTHAWNIVKLGGNYFPIDLTWNASRNANGNSLSFLDIANVNEFVRTHIPGKYEAIQNYERVLKSIDGSYLRMMNNLVNKDMTYELSTVYIERNGKKIFLTQVEEFLVDNRSVYKYIYNVLDGKSGLQEPHIFYSETNVLNVVRGCGKKKKLESQLREARRKGDTKKVEEITNALKGSEYLNDANSFIDNLLFSRENLAAALRRGDNFIGKVNVEYDDQGHSKAVGVVVDPVFAKKINKIHKRFKRSDGTSFILEQYGMLSLPDGQQVYRYKMYETKIESGKLITKKYTVFTDQDILNDNRQLLVDDFLSRSRIERKSKETSGYLGYYSKDNVRTYDPRKVKYFTDDLYRSYTMRSSYVKDFVPELTFNDMKRMVKTYTMEIVNGKKEVINRRTRKIITDPTMKIQIEFSFLWLKVAGSKHYIGEEIPGYSYAYDKIWVEKIFYEISKIITGSIHRSGNIEPLDIFLEVSNNHGLYKYAEDIVEKLFSSQENIRIINQFYRQQNHSSVREKKAIQSFDEYGNFYKSLEDRRRQLEDEKRQLLEVIEQNGRVEIVPARRR